MILIAKVLICPLSMTLPDFKENPTFYLEKGF